MDWKKRSDELLQLSDEDWEKASEQFYDEWRDAYIKEFVSFAVSRNWNENDAGDCANEIAEQAFMNAYEKDYDAIEIARFDVKACEEPI